MNGAIRPPCPSNSHDNPYNYEPPDEPLFIDSTLDGEPVKVFYEPVPLAPPIVTCVEIRGAEISADVFRYDTMQGWVLSIERKLEDAEVGQ